MKTSRAIVLAAVALAFGIFAGRWCAAQSSNQPPAKEPASYDFGAMQQLTSFVTYLQDTKQTNILNQYHDLSTATLASQHYAELGMTLAVLERLRDGRTNQAYELLEGKLDGEIEGFVWNYRELPTPARAQPGLKVLSWARDYRAKYPFKHRYANVDEGVPNAFKILDEKP